MNGFDPCSGIERHGLILFEKSVISSCRVVSITLCGVTMKEREIKVAIIWSSTTQRHVFRVLGESLHRSSPDAFTIAMGVTGIEGTIMVEQAATIYASNIQFIDYIQFMGRRSSRTMFRIFRPILFISMPSFPPSLLLL
jgi:hypothetical protein